MAQVQPDIDTNSPRPALRACAGLLWVDFPLEFADAAIQQKRVALMSVTMFWNFFCRCGQWLASRASVHVK